jgi:DNA-binding MarR family transcriptional regulator
MVDQAGAVPVAGQEGVAVRVKGDGLRAGVASVADSVIDLLRTVRRSKARMLAAASDDVESATQMLLRTAAIEGPMRATALSASVQSDLSTVSRQVAALVTRGLLERRADPVDGRASLLVVTDSGQAVIARHERARIAFFEEVLSGWSPEERGQFAHLLERFTAAYDTTHTHWMTGAARHSARTGDSEEGSTT